MGLIPVQNGVFRVPYLTNESTSVQIVWVPFVLFLKEHLRSVASFGAAFIAMRAYGAEANLQVF